MQQEFFNEIMSMSQAMQSLVKTKLYSIGQKINGGGGHQHPARVYKGSGAGGRHSHLTTLQSSHPSDQNQPQTPPCAVPAAAPPAPPRAAGEAAASPAAASPAAAATPAAAAP